MAVIFDEITGTVEPPPEPPAPPAAAQPQPAALDERAVRLTLRQIARREERLKAD